MASKNPQNAPFPQPSSSLVAPQAPKTTPLGTRSRAVPPKDGGPPTRIQDVYEVEGKKQPGPQADLWREYVAGGGYSWTATYLRSLPHFIDDVTRDFGDDLYDRMLNDSQIASDVGTLKLQILAGGLQILPVVGSGNPESDKALEMADALKRALDRLSDPIETGILHGMLDAMAFGNRVGEITWEIPETGPDTDKLQIRDVKIKPRHATAFVVDAKMNLVGLLGLIPGQGYGTAIVNSFLGDPSNSPNLLPKSKFLILSWRPQNQDVRGVSLLRPAYDPWWMKQQMKGEYLKYLVQFAGPSLYGITGEDAQRIPLQDKDGNIQTDNQGNPIYIEPEIVLLTALQAFRNGTAAAFPYGTEVHPLLMDTKGEPFTEAFRFADSQISKAILHQTLATTEAQHQTRAAAQTHQDILGMVVDYGKAVVCAMLRDQLFRRWVLYNYGEEYLDLTPKCSLGATEKQDFSKDAAAVAALETSGYLDPSQYPELDSKLGLPSRSEESVQYAIQLKLAPLQADQAQIAADANPPGQPAGSPEEKSKEVQPKTQKMANAGG